jgi:N-methylhydantoinase B
MFSNVPLKQGDMFTRPSAGGGGYGDPLEREPASVCEDVADGYVSIERALKDYGVVIREVDAELSEYEVDAEATTGARTRMAGVRRGWLEEDAESVAKRYRDGEFDVLDLVRHYGVILDWGTGELLPKTTVTFREMLQRRAASHWPEVAA